MPRRVNNLNEVNDVLRELFDFYDYIRTKNWDFSQRRIINAHPSVNDYDYVVRKELPKFIDDDLTARGIPKKGAAVPKPNVKTYDKITFGLGVGASVIVGADATPPYIWTNSANGRPDIIAVAANTPPTGANLNFNIRLNGTIMVSYGLPAGTGSKVVVHENVPNPPVIKRYDVVTCDVTQIGSGTAGRGIEIVIFCNLI